LKDLNVDTIIIKTDADYSATLWTELTCLRISIDACLTRSVMQCFSTAGPRPSTGPWHQLYRAARGSPGICHFSFL